MLGRGRQTARCAGPRVAAWPLAGRCCQPPGDPSPGRAAAPGAVPLPGEAAGRPARRDQEAVNQRAGLLF